MASPGFGFSVGDIIAGIGLAVKVCKACKDTGGAFDQFEHIMVELEAYQAVLQRLQNAQYSTMPEIEKFAAQCMIPVQTFRGKIAKYESAFTESPSSPGRSLKDVIQSFKVFPRRAQWALIAIKEVKELRAALQLPLSTLGVFLGLDISISLPRIKSIRENFGPFLGASGDPGVGANDTNVDHADNPAAMRCVKTGCCLTGVPSLYSQRLFLQFLPLSCQITSVSWISWGGK